MSESAASARRRWKFTIGKELCKRSKARVERILHHCRTFGASSLGKAINDGGKDIQAAQDLDYKNKAWIRHGTGSNVC